MASLPLISIPGEVWPAVPRAEVSQLWALVVELQRTQWLSPGEILAGQLTQVRHLIAHCQENVPYYAEQFRQSGIQATDIRTLDDFRRLPILRRNTYREHCAQFQAKSLPAGLIRTGQSKTSGTEGIAISLEQTNLVQLWWHACCLRDIDWCGFDPRGTLASIRNFGEAKTQAIMDGVEWPRWNRQFAPLLLNGRSFAMDIQQEPRRQLQWLLQVQPDYLFSTPSNLVYLAGLLREPGQRISSLRAIQVYAETLTEDDQLRIETSFGVPVKNLYSCTEAGYLASPCPEGHGLHVHAENVLFELLNETGMPCKHGETGRVVLTPLRNHATPFLRYETSDIATLGAERCPCGRGLPLLSDVHGKVRPLLHLPDGRRISSRQLVHLMLKLKVYRQHQIIQRTSDHLLVRVVPQGEWSPEKSERVVKCVQDYLEFPIRVEVQVVDRLELTVGGKVRDVIVECAGREGEASAEPFSHQTSREFSARQEPRPPTRPALAADFFALRPIAGVAWPALPIGNAGQLWSLHRELERTQWLTPEEILDGQLAQLRDLLAHCSQNVPYYRDLFQKADIRPGDIRTLEDFRRVPIQSRQVWQQQFHLMQATAMPAGVTKIAEANSSGTSGVPVKLWQTEHVNLWWLACSMRDLEWCGIDPRGTLASIRILGKIPRAKALAGIRTTYWNAQLHAFLETGPLVAMDVQQDPRRQLQWLMEMQPDYLVSYPSNLEFLAELLRETGQRIPRLKIVQSIAENLTAEARARIEAGFGVPLKNTYSCAEVGYVASPCPLGNGLHVHAENVLVEVLDDDDRPCAPGQTGRVIFTTLHNHATPFVRYDIGDTATLGFARCPCGRGLPLLTEVQGKERPALHLADGRRLPSSPLVTDLRRLDLCYQYQVIQRAVDHFVVRLIPNPHWTAVSAELFVRLVQDYVMAPVRVDVEPVERIAGANGKVRDVVSEL